jgi:hypothetical protein
MKELNYSFVNYSSRFIIIIIIIIIIVILLAKIIFINRHCTQM